MASNSHDLDQIQMAEKVTSIIQSLRGSQLEAYMHTAVQVRCSNIAK